MLKIYKKWNFVYKACRGHTCGEGLFKVWRTSRPIIDINLKK